MCAGSYGTICVPIMSSVFGGVLEEISVREREDTVECGDGVEEVAEEIPPPPMEWMEHTEDYDMVLGAIRSSEDYEDMPDLVSDSDTESGTENESEPEE